MCASHTSGMKSEVPYIQRQITENSVVSRFVFTGLVPIVSRCRGPSVKCDWPVLSQPARSRPAIHCRCPPSCARTIRHSAKNLYDPVSIQTSWSRSHDVVKVLLQATRAVPSHSASVTEASCPSSPSGHSRIPSFSSGMPRLSIPYVLFLRGVAFGTAPPLSSS
ncbi:hypothetical protein K466DRAFT_338240 [Polyporus arcularius HHB13444]|uniref:Uncharacterized protein n=1 Tax=Polyporus arcularius HHB13444 TaxID=1314778 RepID=A0A5C3PPE3_9APHY|nr:hypothetical protein K466DRAFT_338240 [Polyporus arcularius HHB13444]